MALKNLVLILKKKNNQADYTKIVEDYSHGRPVDLSNYEVYQANSVHSFKDEIFDYVMERGFSSLFTSQPLLEDAVPRGTSTNSIAAILHKFLDRMSIDSELIIVDPYFLAASRNPTYEAMFCDILEKYLPAIDDLIFITNNQISRIVKTNIEAGLRVLKPTLNIQFKTSPNYHDRYWISANREKGIVMGTSLNGLGNKLALVDRLNTSDVRIIVQELIDDNMI